MGVTNADLICLLFPLILAAIVEREAWLNRRKRLRWLARHDHC